MQVRKGVLELVVLLSVRSGETYGYELITSIAHAMEFELTEGTIYPLLSRLSKEGLITGRWVQGEGSVPRKYYRISPRGRAALDEMEASWLHLTRSVQRLTSKSRSGARGRGEPVDA